MAICNAIEGISYSCLNNVGGIKKAYLTNFENVTAYTTDVDGVINDITLAPSSVFVEFQFNSNTGSLQEELTSDLTNGTTFYTQTVNLVIPRREAAKRDKILILAQGQPKLAIIILDSNGLYWYVGLGEGAYLTANATGSGVAKADANNYQLTFVAEEAELAPEVDSAIIPALLV